MRAMRITFPPLFYDVLCKASGSVSRQTDSQHLQKALLLGSIDSPLGGPTLEDSCSFGYCGWIEDVFTGKLLSIKIAASANKEGCLLEIVGSAAQFNGGSQQRPIGAGSPFVGHTNATGIDEAYPAMVAIELHMCVPANHDLLRDISQDHVQTLIRSGSGQGFFIAAGRAVTEEDSAQALDRQDELFLK